jgi:mycofactocin precursor
VTFGADTMAPGAMKQEVLMSDSPAVTPAADQDENEPLATDELLVEEVSIDGMCGVY